MNGHNHGSLYSGTCTHTQIILDDCSLLSVVVVVALFDLLLLCSIEATEMVLVFALSLRSWKQG